MTPLKLTVPLASRLARHGRNLAPPTLITGRGEARAHALGQSGPRGILRRGSWCPGAGGCNQRLCMRKIFGTVGTFLIGSIGWAIGQRVGLGTAVVLSAIGSGVGLYWGRRLFEEWLG